MPTARAAGHLLSLRGERRQRRAKGKTTCWFSPYVTPFRQWGLIQESLSTNINEGIMQISLISFCKAKALAIHRLIGAQQSDSISFFAQTVSGGEVPRRETAGSSPWYAFASFPRIRKGRAPPRHERQRKGYRVPRRGMSEKSEKLPFTGAFKSLYIYQFPVKYSIIVPAPLCFS